MAGLPWIKVAVDFAEHPKALALAHRLSDSRAVLYLPPVWGHFARYYPGGSMPDSEPAIHALERAALWQGSPGELVKALVEVGFLSRKKRRVAVHDWGDWQEAHTKKLELDRSRMRAKRAKLRQSQYNGRATVERQTGDSRAIEERREDKRRIREEVVVVPDLQRSKTSVVVPEREAEKKLGSAPTNGPNGSRSQAELIPAVELTQLDESATPPALAEGDGGQSRPPPPKPKKPNGTDPRFAPLRAAYEAEFEAATGQSYRWQGAKDARAIHALIAVPVDEFRRKARAGLKANGFCRSPTVAQLAAKWNDIAASNVNGTGPPKDETGLVLNRDGTPSLNQPARGPESFTKRVTWNFRGPPPKCS